MNKFKKILLGTLSILTLGLFVATGAKVNAATVTRTYDFYNNNLKGTADLTLVANGENEDFECASSEDSTEKMTLNIDNVSNGTFRWKNSDAYVEFQCKNNSAATLTYTFTTKGDATLVSKINTGGGSKYVKYSIDNGTKTQFASGTTGGTEFSFDFVGAGEHTLVFSDALGSSGSNMKIYSLTITDVYDTASAEDQAVAAISAIGTVEYTTACKNLIDIATTRVNAVAEAKRNATYISNYEAYTSAVSTFNGLESAKISTFTAAVANIGEVSASSGTAISTAETAYADLIASTKENATVIAAKATLDSAKVAYDNALYDSYSKKVTANNCENTDNNGVTSNTRADGSIFTLLPKCRVNDYPCTSNGMTFSKRFQTAGKVGFSSNEVSEKAIKFETKRAGILKVLAMSASSTSDDATTRTLDIYKSGSKTPVYTSAYLPTAYADMKFEYITLSDSDTYYIGSAVNNISVLYIEFIETSVAKPVLEQQENLTGTAIRYIATLSNVADVEEVVSWSATLTFGAKSHTIANQTVLYTGVSGENGKTRSDETTYYLVATLSGIPTTFTGTISCVFNVKLTNGTIQSNIINYTVE